MHATPAATPLDAALPVRMPSEAVPSRLRELTTGLANGDDAAWVAFHREYGPGLFRYLLGGTRGDYDLAAEALQQAYLRIARHARPCDSAPQFEGWLRLVAGSALNDCRRRKKHFWQFLIRSADDAAESDPATALEAAGDDRALVALDSALTRLDPADRALLEEKYIAGVDVRTLAAQREITPKAAESRLTRARGELRRHLTAVLSRHE